MPVVSSAAKKKLSEWASLTWNERSTWRAAWSDLADYFLPHRYSPLLSAKEVQLLKTMRNPLLIDSTGTKALRTLASGLGNGITSPARPWFKLTLKNKKNLSNNAKIWLAESTAIIRGLMAETNFYTVMNQIYVDLGLFGTASALVYEDFDSVFTMQHCPVGEFFLTTDFAGRVNGFGREIYRSADQLAREFGEENLLPTTRKVLKEAASAHKTNIVVKHLIQINDNPEEYGLAPGFPFREVYWELGGANSSSSSQETSTAQVLRVSGYYEYPGISPRWEVVGNSPYGVSPAMEVLGDVIQLQHMGMRRAQAIDMNTMRPVIADTSLQHKRTALTPGGITFAQVNSNSVGVKPIFDRDIQIRDLMEDVGEVRTRVKLGMFNDLFRMIADLDTVRSATEIAGLQEEKLVLLGSVLGRFETEALDPVINRIFNIANRAGLLPDMPEELNAEQIDISYSSILTAAQTAAAAIPTERFLQVIGNVAALWPGATLVPNWVNLLLNYAEALGMSPDDLEEKKAIMAKIEGMQKMQEGQQAMQEGGQLAAGAKLLSETDVGGGQNALQQLIGGA